MRKGTRVVANAKGYPKEKKGVTWNPDLVLEV